MLTLFLDTLYIFSIFDRVGLELVAFTKWSRFAQNFLVYIWSFLVKMPFYVELVFAFSYHVSPKEICVLCPVCFLFPTVLSLPISFESYLKDVSLLRFCKLQSIGNVLLYVLSIYF